MMDSSSSCGGVKSSGIFLSSWRGLIFCALIVMMDLRFLSSFLTLYVARLICLMIVPLSQFGPNFGLGKFCWSIFSQTGWSTLYLGQEALGLLLADCFCCCSLACVLLCLMIFQAEFCAILIWWRWSANGSVCNGVLGFAKAASFSWITPSQSGRRGS